MTFSKLSICLIVLWAAYFAIVEASDPPLKGQRIIYPGTHYCGQGNSGKDGKAVLAKVDNCCRIHDSCPTGIRSGASKYGVKNTGKFTVMSCDCDKAFRSCLKKAGGFNAGLIATIFNATAGKTCLKKDAKPKCIKYSKKKCVSWKTHSICKA